MIMTPRVNRGFLALVSATAVIVSIAACGAHSTNGTGTIPSPAAAAHRPSPGGSGARSSSTYSTNDFAQFCVEANQALGHVDSTLPLDAQFTINALASRALAQGKAGPVPTTAYWQAALSQAQSLARFAPPDPNVQPYAVALVGDIDDILKGDTSTDSSSAAYRTSGDAGAVYGWSVDHCPTDGVVTAVPSVGS